MFVLARPGSGSFLAGLMYDVKDMLLEMVKSEKLANKEFVKDPFIMPKP